MTIDEMFNELENKVRDTYIVTLKYKYDFEIDYTIENNILEYDSMADNYVWLDDWYEGQTDVEVLGYRLLNEIDNTKLEPCEDAISRKETLNKINALLAEYIPLMLPGWTLPLNIGRTICGMPSVQPQQKWIPCSKKQPEVKGQYLITMCVKAPMCRTLYETIIGSWRGEKGWYFETDPGVVAKYYVLAWMPLPEPYKESEDGNEK